MIAAFCSACQQSVCKCHNRGFREQRQSIAASRPIPQSRCVTFADGTERGLILEGVATTPRPTKHGGVWGSRSPAGARFTLPLPLLLSHDSDCPIGSVVAAHITDTEIEIRALVEPPGTLGYDRELLRAVWNQIESGEVAAFSVGRALAGDNYWLRPGADERARLGTEWIAHTARWGLAEISVTPHPANSDARITRIIPPSNPPPTQDRR